MRRAASPSLSIKQFRLTPVCRPINNVQQAIRYAAENSGVPTSLAESELRSVEGFRARCFGPGAPLIVGRWNLYVTEAAIGLSRYRPKRSREPQESA
jgi:hypothetical protein